MTLNVRAPVLALALLIAPLLALDAAFAHGFHGPQGHVLSLGSPWVYFKLGALHMLTGYDHLLFLFGVMFFSDATKRHREVYHRVHGRAQHHAVGRHVVPRSGEPLPD